MMSRSASRTRWMMFCLAAWAAMRPNFSAGSLASNSSPTSASGSSFCRASARVTWFSGSSTCSTTVLISNSSTSPSSVLNFASMFFSGPKVFFAADSIASSSAFTMIWRSIPFSLLTCSMTRVKSGCMATSQPSRRRARLPRRAGEVVFDVCLFDGGERDVDGTGVGIVDVDLLGGYGGEPALELPPPTDQLPRPDAHALPESALEVHLAHQRPVDPGRRALEVVAPAYRVVAVEHVAELAGNVHQLIEGDASFGSVDQQAQHEAPALGTILHVDELESPREDEGLRELPDALGHRRPIHGNASSRK